jgi:hypothetical protein
VEHKEDLISPMSAPDEYSRVTNSERFRPLQEAVLEIAAELQRRYMVEVYEGSDLEDQFQNVGMDRTRSHLINVAAG